MKIRNTLLALALFISCAQAQQSPHEQSNIHQFVVAEVLQATSYTYLLAVENNTEQWLALPKIVAEIGETYYYYDGVEMRDFKSAELDRTFASILFLQGVQSAETIEPDTNESQDSTSVLGTATAGKIEPPKGGITIEQLMANKANYESKEVLIRAKVVKYNSGIMGKNWLHLQDGTASGVENDLTVTTDMETKVGDVITVYGTIILDKDFGSGYFYKIIMEDASIME
jgi:hypothetical protein